MSAFDPGKPYADDFADLRAEAIETLRKARQQRAACEKAVADKKAELIALQATVTQAQQTEDNLLGTLANLERWARGDFEGVQPGFSHE